MQHYILAHKKVAFARHCLLGIIKQVRY